MKKIEFENGVLVSPAKVVIDGVEHEVTPAVCEGKTPFSAENINKMQDNMEEAIDEISVAIYGTGDEKGLIDPNTTLENLILTQNANGPDEGAHFYHIKTIFYEEKSTESNRCQIALGYNTNRLAYRYYSKETWSKWEFFKTDEPKLHTYSVLPDKTILASAWQIVNDTDYSLELKKGTYRVVTGIMGMAAASGTGMASIRTLVNGLEKRGALRSSFPISNSLKSSAQSETYVEVENDATYTFNAQIFASLDMQLDDFVIYVQKVS